MKKYLLILCILISCGTPPATYKDQLAAFQKNHPNTVVNSVIASTYEDQSSILITFYQNDDPYTSHTYRATSRDNDVTVQKDAASFPFAFSEAIPVQQTVSFDQAVATARGHIDYPYLSVTGVLYNRDLSKGIHEESDYIWNISFFTRYKKPQSQPEYVLIDALTGEVISVRNRFGDEIQNEE